MSQDKEGVVLGIDVGSVSISIVSIDLQGRFLESGYILHHGNIRDSLGELLEDYDHLEIIGKASPSGKAHFSDIVRIYDQQVALMEAARDLGPGARSLLHVGAERFYMIELDGSGNYLRTRSSSSCAAGTGSFLDQQALRLNLEDTSQLSDLALSNSSPVPDIAARCSVFAKTDLIHAQQKGYGLEAICDSLCKGLADNIADTLFNKSDPIPPVYMSGGVSKNRSVVRHLQRIIGSEIIIHPNSHHLPALGAALLLQKELVSARNVKTFRTVKSLDLLLDPGELSYFFEPLEPPARQSSDLEISDHFEYVPSRTDHTMGVQVDLFQNESIYKGGYYLGIDVGSTSTKAVLVSKTGKAYAGFYTYTSGQPLKATQALFEAIDHLSDRHQSEIRILGCATTGSGRKFIGGIVGADQDLDEITAHARAAFELNPRTDTIIEIGGQDAKFTQMKNGTVTFSHMNTVCAAGTGSFIEELAGRLGVELRDYENLALNRPAPLASDRCTVFMERDINQLLSQGYSVEEVLATVIHSVRENYLKKVASESHIGDNICFQGATARNRALVAAFEQRLQKPIYVSSLCHLTGALGTALLLKEEMKGSTSFRGLDLYKRAIPVQTETCELCLNTCTISVARLNGSSQAYGFLCGRDYETHKFVSKGKTGFDLMKERRNLLRSHILKGKTKIQDGLVVGIPATLHLLDDLPFWTAFFNELDIPVQTSFGFRDSLKTGKKIAGAEFCAPIDSMYGHVAYIAQQCNYVFLPVYLESRLKTNASEQNFCYYTQFSSSLAFQEGPEVKNKMISPQLNFNKSEDYNARQLIAGLKQMGFKKLHVSDISKALKNAGSHARKLEEKLHGTFQDLYIPDGDVSVLLLGRPYVVLSDTLNKGIPDIFAGMGINAWYQDMLPLEDNPDEAMSELIEKIPWHFASHILRAGEKTARMKNLYPVLITAFKCAPDSFIIEYFKQIMHLYGKPYLIIQIDEHDSNTGYETRIEAALRSFRNHARDVAKDPKPDLGSILPAIKTDLNGKTLLMPNWDQFVSPLLAANLKRAGIDAHLLEPNQLGIRKSMVHNTGQCLPINIIAQNYIDYIENHSLDPANVILWMMEGKATCNLRQYPYYIKRILENYGRGMEKASVYSGELTHREMSMGVTYYAYFAYMIGGLFRKVACRIRPYEIISGETDAVFRKVQSILMDAFNGNFSLDHAIKSSMEIIDGIKFDNSFRKPLIAIFGDLYVRDNDIMNQDLVRDIERAGGEALVTPYHDYTKLVIENIFRRATQRGEYVETGKNRILLNVVKFMDDRFYKPFSKYLGPAPVIKPKILERHLKDYNISLLHSGESYDNILKIFYIVENFPEVALFIQTNPSFCCPALVTEAMTDRIREKTGVPIVTITYDGTSDQVNDAIVPYIQNLAGKQKVSQNPQ